MSDFTAVETSAAPRALGPYSQGIRWNSMLFLSGQVGIDPDTGKMVSGGMEAQARQAFTNIRAVLEAAGADFTNVVKTTVYLVNLEDFAGLNTLYQEYFSAPYPARAAIGVRELPAGALVEIEVTAVL